MFCITGFLCLLQSSVIVKVVVKEPSSGLHNEPTNNTVGETENSTDNRT